MPSSDGGWHSAANAIGVDLPSSLASPVTLTKGGSSIGFTLAGGAGAGSATGTVASYSAALPSTAATYTVTGSGVKERLSLASVTTPSSFAWSLHLSSGLSAQLVGGVVEIINASGPVATIGAPTVTDASGVSGPAGWQLSGATLTLPLDPAWLTDPGRAFPVIVDPSVTYLGPTQGCTLDAAHPTNTYCDTTDLGVGASGGVAQRSVLYYPGFTDGTLPVDAVIQGAEMDLPVDTQTGSVTVNAYGLTRGQLERHLGQLQRHQQLDHRRWGLCHHADWPTMGSPPPTSG